MTGRADDLNSTKKRVEILTGELESFTRQHLHNEIEKSELLAALNKRGGNKLLSLGEINFYLQMRMVLSEQQRHYLLT